LFEALIKCRAQGGAARDHRFQYAAAKHRRCRGALVESGLGGAFRPRSLSFASCDPITTPETNCGGEIVAAGIRPRSRPDWIRTMAACWFSAWAGARVGDATCCPSTVLLLR